MPYQLDIRAFAGVVRAKRAGRTLREVAQEVGAISPATLSRIEHEKAPDLPVFLQLCNWLELKPGQFLLDSGSRPPAPAEPLATIIFLLRSDPRLDPATANVLVAMIEASYRALRHSPR